MSVPSINVSSVSIDINCVSELNPVIVPEWVINVSPTWIVPDISFNTACLNGVIVGALV